MAKQVNVDVLISQMHKLPIEGLLKLQRETAKSISEAEQEAKKEIEEKQATLELIRNGGNKE